MRTRHAGGVRTGMTNIHDQVLNLAEAIRAEVVRALLVGGCVRDELMGRQAKDWDLRFMALKPLD